MPGRVNLSQVFVIKVTHPARAEREKAWLGGPLSWRKYLQRVLKFQVSALAFRHSLPVLARSCCCNTILYMGWLVNNRNLFLMDLETGKSRIKVPADSMSVGSPLPRSQMAPFLCVYMREGVRDLSGIFFIRLHPHNLVISQGPHHLIPSS